LIGDESFNVGLVYLDQPGMPSNRNCNTPILFGSFLVLVSDQCVCFLFFWICRFFFLTIFGKSNFALILCLYSVDCQDVPLRFPCLFFSDGCDQLLDHCFVSNGGSNFGLQGSGVLLSDGDLFNFPSSQAACWFYL
jgi:hypothetical protein